MTDKIGLEEYCIDLMKVDFKRMFKSELFYILIACALVIPILITVVITMMDGFVSVAPKPVLKP